MMHYYRITNGASSDTTRSYAKRATIRETEFLAAVGQRPPDGRADLQDSLKTAHAEAERALSRRAAQWLRDGSESIWSLSDETGQAEGWIVRNGPAEQG
jgi:hypothetical protein